MPNPRTKAKMKYNRQAYRRYEFNLGVDSKLNALVERYKSYPDSNLSQLIKSLLCGHFGISVDEGESNYPEYFMRQDGNIPNTELDRILALPPVKG